MKHDLSVLAEKMILLTGSDQDNGGAGQDNLPVLQSLSHNKNQSLQPCYMGDSHVLQPSSGNENRSLEPRYVDDLHTLQSSGSNENQSLEPRLTQQNLEVGSAGSLELCMTWGNLGDLKYNEDISSFLESVHGSSDVQALQLSAKHFLRLRERGTFFFKPADISCVAKRRAMLNNQCINGGALLLQDLVSRQQTDDAHITCTILSTHDLPCILCNAPDEEIWCNTKRTIFWSMHVWILPIHWPKESHWVLAVIKLNSREIFLYDSLARTCGRWKADVQVWTKPTLGFMYTEHCL
jgi:hypothetical protein